MNNKSINFFNYKNGIRSNKHRYISFFMLINTAGQAGIAITRQ